MNLRFNNQNLWKLILLFVLITLIGLTPRAHQVSTSMQQAQRAADHNMPAEAADHLVTAAERQPWRTDLWELAGHYALIAREPEDAISYLEKAAVRSKDGLSMHAQIDLGDAYYQIGSIPDAQEILEIANQAHGPNYEVSQRLIQIYREQENYTAATAVLEQLIEYYPDDPKLHFEQALLYAANGDVEAAQDSLERAADMDSTLADNVESLRSKIALARRETDPAYAPLLICQGLAALEKWELAAKACKQSIDLYSDYAEAWAYLGLAYYQLDTAGVSPTGSDGLAELETALALDPNSLAANSLLAMYWMSNQDYNRALQAMQKAIEIAPERAGLYVDLGALLALSGDLQAAFEAYLHAVELAPFQTTYMRQLADFSLRYEFQVEQVALPAARKAVIMAPDEAANQDQMAQVMTHLSDLASAKRFAHRAIEIDPNYAPAYLHLGLIYLLENNPESGRQALNTAITLAPDSVTATQAKRLMETYFP